MLEHIVGQLGFRIDLLDWGSNCNVGSYDNLRRMAPYADFIIASDLSLGYTTHTGHYDTLLTAGRSLRDTVKALLDADRQGYVAGAAELAARGYHEAVYAFDARRLLELLQRIDLDPAEDDPAVCAANLDCAYPYNGGSARVGDVLTYIRKNAGASAATAFEALRFYGVNSRDLSTWSDNYSKANGLFFVNWLFRT